MDTKRIIASRLSEELERRGIELNAIPNTLSLDKSILSGYLSAQRNLNLFELGDICSFLGINLFTFLSNKYSVPSLKFKSFDSRSTPDIQKIESALQIIKDYFPEASTPNEWTIDSLPSERNDILNQAISSVKKTKENAGTTVEEIYKKFNIPVVIAPFSSFEAFIFAASNKHIVCCSGIGKADARIHSSLLHEFAHFAFEKPDKYHVDENIYFFTGDNFRGQEREFFATKFAQFFLAPYDEVENIAENWERFDISMASNLLRKNRTSKEVLAHSLVDVFKIKGMYNYADFEYVHNRIDEASGGTFQNLSDFISGNNRKISTLIEQNKENFSDEVYDLLTKNLLTENLLR